MDRLILYSESNVGFSIEPKKVIIGTFMLTRTKNDLLFEWIPKNPIVILGKEQPKESFHIGFRVSDVVRIEEIGKTLSHVSLVFLFEDSSKLPPFRFCSKHAIASVRHLFEFLSSKGIIEDNYVSWKSPEEKPLPRGFLSHLDTQYISEHIRIMKSFGKPLIVRNDPIKLEEAKSCIKDLDRFKKVISNRGLCDESRWLVWPYLLGLFDTKKSYEENAKELEKQNNEYKQIISTWNTSFIDAQINEVQAITRLSADVMKDVRRTDRSLKQFSGDDNPNLSVLNNVLIAYANYSRDTGFVQGMGDLVATFIVLYVKEWNKQSNGEYLFKLADGRELNQEDTEAFIFQLFCAMMRVTQQDRMFTDLVKQQEFAFERVFAIIQEFHRPLAEWLQTNKLDNMIFMYRQLILLFKREFEPNMVKRLWDSLFAHAHPWAQSRFFCAALMIVAFPRLLLETNGTIEEVMNEVDRAIAEADVEECIGLADILSQKKTADCACDCLPNKDAHVSYKSMFLKI